MWNPLPRSLFTPYEICALNQMNSVFLVQTGRRIQNKSFKSKQLALYYYFMQPNRLKIKMNRCIYYTEFVFGCLLDFMLNLETEFGEWGLLKRIG